MGERGRFWTAPTGRLVHETGDERGTVYLEKDTATKLKSIRRQVWLENFLGGFVGRILRRVSPRNSRTF